VDPLSLEALVSKLRDLGVRAQLDGDRITFTPPPPVELRVELRRHKAELLGLLRRVEGEGQERRPWGACSIQAPGTEREIVRDERGRVVALASWVRIH
jgi:hypothetical protein